MDDRRSLTFERIDEVMPEVERLLVGHATTKGWTLGQILSHLATTIRLSLASDAPSQATPRAPDLERTFEVRRRRFFRSGRFPEGLDPPFEVQLPPVDADERVEAASLAASLRLLQASEGPFPDHPMLGRLSKEEWVDFHRIHCAHHLGFAKVATPD